VTAKKRAGFTLIEVLLAVSFLALGTLMIQEGFLRSTTFYGRYVNTMRASSWMSERLWEARQAALFSKDPPVSEGGSFESEGLVYRWTLDVKQPNKGVYQLRLAVDWGEPGRGGSSIVREIYATNLEPAV
jgi:hypothetical protein